MADAVATTVNKPVWVDLGSSDAAGSREFYAKLFGWDLEVSPDPQYGGYATGKLNGKDVGGIGPTQSPEQPTAWSLYIGTDDVDELAKKVTAAGGTVTSPPFDVGDQGRMAVFQDPSGAFISAWRGTAMSGFGATGANTYGWAELNSRDMGRAVPFYAEIFGWATKTSPMGEGQPPYTEFQVDGQSIAGGMDMNPMVPAEVPSYWMVYFSVPDVDASYQTAIGAGAKEMVSPSDFPGGRFAIVSDPQGAAFGLLSMRAA
jgi:predicted enzyme related to lactoylglutathione lyase